MTDTPNTPDANYLDPTVDTDATADLDELYPTEEDLGDDLDDADFVQMLLDAGVDQQTIDSVRAEVKSNLAND